MKKKQPKKPQRVFWDKTEEERLEILGLEAEKDYEGPIKSFIQLEDDYKEYVKTIGYRQVDLGLWLPELNRAGGLKPLVPGELAVILADTGTGKTTVLDNIAYKLGKLCVKFELELPDSQCYERTMAMKHCRTQQSVEDHFSGKNEQGVSIADALHIYTCTKAGMSCDAMKQDVQEWMVDTGFPSPSLIVVDYIGLMSGDGRGKHEIVSGVAKGLKTMAKELDTVVIATSQIARKNETDDPTVYLHDGKYSGAIENSAQCVLGMWKDVDDHKKMWFRTNKFQRGRPGGEVPALFDGDTMNIDPWREPSPFDDEHKQEEVA